MGRITKSEAKAMRQEKIEKFAARDAFQVPRKGVDNGAAGRVFELMNARDGSTKCGVSKGKQADNYMSIIQPDGSKKRYELESKTNGGRVDEVMEKLSRGREFFVAYSLSICNKSTGGKLREAEPIVCLASTFIAALEECGALKAVNGRDGQQNGIAIQVTKKAWFEWVSDYPVKWDRDFDYSWYDFMEL